jgi:FeS assembly SUF system protein
VAPIADPDRTLALKADVVEAISAVFDPEIPVNVYELGLIYDIVIDAAAVVHVTMTLTSPMCPSAQQLPAEVQTRIRAVSGVQDVHVAIVWEPPWSAELMSDVARLQLGL